MAKRVAGSQKKYPKTESCWGWGAEQSMFLLLPRSGLKSKCLRECKPPANRHKFPRKHLPIAKALEVWKMTAEGTKMGDEKSSTSNRS